MPAHAGLFTKSLVEIISVIELMASPEGTTINELASSLSLTRRSVFRLIRTIEHDLNIPVIVDRKLYGGVATYRLPPEFVEKFSNKTAPSLILSFRQAVLLHLLLKDDVFQNKQ
jgi:predicted DNA-binding transcriptional regulator YafY